MTGWKDRTQFHGTLPDTVRGPTSTNTVDWQSKISQRYRVSYLSNQKLLHYSEDAKNQLIS